MSNYPTGTEYDPNAPYNQTDQESILVGVRVTTTIVPTTATVAVNDYEAYEEWDDDQGYYMQFDISDAAVEEAYREDHWMLSELLEDYMEILKDKMEECTTDKERRVLHYKLEAAEDYLDSIEETIEQR